jgi:hypothetical protein
VSLPGPAAILFTVDASGKVGRVRATATQCDFYGSPAIAPDGSVADTGSFSGVLGLGDQQPPAVTIDGRSSRNESLPMALENSSFFVARYAADGSLIWGRGVTNAVGGVTAVQSDGAILAGGTFEAPAVVDVGLDDSVTLTSSIPDRTFYNNGVPMQVNLGMFMVSYAP